VVDGSGLENRRTERFRGFESHPLRPHFPSTAGVPGHPRFGRRALATGNLAESRVGLRRWLAWCGPPPGQPPTRSATSLLTESAYATTIFSNIQLLFAVDGLEQPAMGRALQQLTVTWDGARKATCAADFLDWGPVDGGSPGFLWSSGRMLRPRVGLAVQRGDDLVFSGRVTAVESRLAGGEAPAFAVRAKGDAPVRKSAGLAARPLRWGADLLRLVAEVKGSGSTGTTARLQAEAIGEVALGQAAVRPGSAIEVLDVGALFAGHYVLTRLELHFDPLRGLHVEFTAERAGATPQGHGSHQPMTTITT
jgi:hypothetical protein